ncbi:MAG: DUF1080 domain-containing protein [Maioricimonas sp. JB049]
MQPTSFGRLLPFLLLTVMVPGLAADDDRSRAEIVYTDPANVDEDFHFQGEYRGWQRSQPSHRSSRSVGLQVIARGEGNFEAVKYYNGLPGAGWQQEAKYILSGSRQADIVTFPGEQYDIVIDGTRALIFAADGRPAGEMQKVYRVSPTMGAEPPPGSIVLFDGSPTDRFRNPKITDDGLLMAGTETTEAYADFLLHGEFRLPYKPFARGQARGNSGFYLQRRYEIQVLDSFGLEGKRNECGALYKTRSPDINMCLPPLQWQTYDIDFTAARFDASGNKVADARLTVWHNGVVIHNDVEIPNKTGAGRPEGPDPIPTLLQDHSNPVVFRNLWLLPKDGTAPVRRWVQSLRQIPPVPVYTRTPPWPVTVHVGD